jgi:hypothetical protein
MGAREVLTSIHNWMAGLRRAVMMNRLASGALLSLAGLLLISLAILLLETIGHFSGSVRAILLTIWGLSALLAIGLGIVWPLLRYMVFAPSDKKLAGDYAQSIPKVRDRVLNALQLLERVESANKEGYSPDLMLEAGRGVAEDLVPINPKELPDKHYVKSGLRYAMVMGIAAILLFAFVGRSLLSAGERVMKPGEEFAKPAPFTLSITPGDVELVRGDSLTVNIHAEGELPKQVTLTRMEIGKTAGEPVTLEGTDGDFKYTYKGITSSFNYWAASGRVSTERYKISVRELPAVRFLSVRLTPPAYTGLEERVLEENVGDISAVVGTTAKLSIASTKPLLAATVEFLKAGSKDEEILSTLDLKPEGSRGEGVFTINDNCYYRIRLTDADRYESTDAILYRITARPDEHPLVNLRSPGSDIDITANSQVPIVAEAVDDFGFTRMNLRYFVPSPFEATREAEDSEYETVPLTYKMVEQGRAVGEYIFDLEPLGLLPEDQVRLFVEVWDNDRISNPKRARSETRTLRYPSMAEIFEQEEQQAETQQMTLGDLLKESADLREKVDEAMEEFKSNPDMNWERKKELEQLMEKQQQMNQVLEKVAEAIEKAQLQNEIRSMFSPEITEKMQQIQELVQDVITPEMRKALEKMAQAMQQPTEEEMREALENFKMTQENFERALDQTLNMLKQMQMEKKLDELARRLDELGRQQEQLNEKMDQNSPQNAEQNAKKQEELSKEMKDIEKEMQKLAEQMQKEQTEQNQEAQQLQQEMEKESLSEQMEQNSESMKMCQNSSCKKSGKRMRKKMAEFAQQMQDMREQMQSNQDQEALEKMERVRDQMLDLSMRQEQLWQESSSTDNSSPQMAQIAEEQENLRQALSRINQDMTELARESMAVTPKLMASINEAINQMQKACDASQERDSRTATHFSQQSLAALNVALKNQQQACSQCQSQCNKPNSNSMCNKAGSMAKKQNGLKQQCTSMCNNPGQLNPGEQAAMQRMASEQSALAKSAEELASEAAASRQSLGRLDDLAKEMEEVADEMRNQQVTQRTIEKQEKIESRLLDFQRANREREFSPRRRAATGIDMVRSSPLELPQKPGQEQLREDLLRALDAKYTPDYEELIRNYFDALSKWK